LQNYATYINAVSADVYAVNEDGQIIGDDPNDVVTFNKAHNIATYACVSNYNNDEGVQDFDSTLAEAALVTHKDTLIPALVALAADGGYDGINIDFEGIAYSHNLDSVRATFSSFIHELAGGLHAKGLKLIISVPAKTGDSLDDDWSYPFDLAALGADADYLQLMTYDEHGPGWSDSGPISGLDWVEQTIEFSVSQTDPAKLLIGFPAYGYDWVSDGSDGVFSWVDFPALLQKPGAESHWDETSQSPWVTYTEDGLVHTIWYENDASIRAKAALVKMYALGGWSMWALGDEDQAFWDAAISGG
jgi:spore germination protein YaaH